MNALLTPNNFQENVSHSFVAKIMLRRQKS